MFKILFKIFVVYKIFVNHWPQLKSHANYSYIFVPAKTTNNNNDQSIEI